jgi:hypothetical protein
LGLFIIVVVVGDGKNGFREKVDIQAHTHPTVQSLYANSSKVIIPIAATVLLLDDRIACFGGYPNPFLAEFCGYV